MDRTHLIDDEVEPAIRRALEERFGMPFQAGEMSLVTGGSHRFGAVSADGRIVAEIQAASAGETTGQEDAALNSAIVDLYFLDLASAQKKLLVFADEAEHREFLERMEDRIVPSVEVVPITPATAAGEQDAARNSGRSGTR